MNKSVLFLAILNFSFFSFVAKAEEQNSLIEATPTFPSIERAEHVIGFVMDDLKTEAISYLQKNGSITFIANFAFSSSLLISFTNYPPQKVNFDGGDEYQEEGFARLDVVHRNLAVRNENMNRTGHCVETINRFYADVENSTFESVFTQILSSKMLETSPFEISVRGTDGAFYIISAESSESKHLVARAMDDKSFKHDIELMNSLFDFVGNQLPQATSFIAPVKAGIQHFPD